MHFSTDNNLKCHSMRDVIIGDVKWTVNNQRCQIHRKAVIT